MGYQSVRISTSHRKYGDVSLLGASAGDPACQEAPSTSSSLFDAHDMRQPDRHAGPKARDPSAQANGLGTQTPYRAGRPNGARYLAPAPRTAASSQTYARRRRLDVDGIATLQAASADHFPNPGRWPGLRNHGPLGRRGTNIGASHQPP